MPPHIRCILSTRCILTHSHSYAFKRIQMHSLAHAFRCIHSHTHSLVYADAVVCIRVHSHVFEEEGDEEESDEDLDGM